MHDLNAAFARDQIRGIGDILSNLSGYLIVYLLWVYSFKLAILLAIIGGASRAGMGNVGIWMIVVGGVIYLVTCYLPFIEYSPSSFGIPGTMILALFLFIVWHWMKRRPVLEGSARITGDLRMAGYYLLVVATC